MNSFLVFAFAMVASYVSLANGCRDIHPSCAVLYPDVCDPNGGERFLCQKTCGDCAAASGCRDEVPKVFCDSFIQANACHEPEAQRVCRRSCDPMCRK